jgi:hypothetical protein
VLHIDVIARLYAGDGLNLGRHGLKWLPRSRWSGRRLDPPDNGFLRSLARRIIACSAIAIIHAGRLGTACGSAGE